MAIRHQLAAYSPVTVRSIAAGMRAGDTALDRLAEVLRRDYQAREAILVDSGTHALELALRIAAKALGSDAIVALPAFSCFDLATAVVGAGSRVVLYDLDPASLAPDQASLEHALGDGARVVVIAPLYGMPVDWDALEALAGRHGALLIEDAAQGHGASWRGRPLGSLSAISTISFSRGKGWTGGHGGAVLLRGRASASGVAFDAPSRQAEARNVMGLSAQWALGRPAVYGVPRAIPGLALGETRYHAPTPVAAMTRSAAAALLASRDASIAEAAARRDGVARMQKEIAGARGIRDIAPIDGAVPGYLRQAVLVRGGMGGLRGEDEALRLGIAPSYPRVLADLPALAALLVRRASDPGAAELARDLITLPTHSQLSLRDRKRIREIVTSI